MRMLLAGAFAAFTFVLPAAAAEFETNYSVRGTQADSGREYTGTVSITPTGETTYQVVWVIAGQKFVGTGIGNTEGLAVAYKSGDQTGIAIYHMQESGQVDGFWTYAGGTKVYDEHWSPN